MRSHQHLFIDNAWQPALAPRDNAQLLLVFGNHRLLFDQNIQADIRSHFPQAQCIGCTTSGEIAGDEVHDDALVLTSVEFECSSIALSHVNINDFPDSKAAGRKLASQIDTDGLKYLLVFSDGQLVNGTALVAGLREALPEDVTISGGLAGDGDRFETTYVWCGEDCASGMIAVCGFYGDALLVGHGSLGGWDSFGPSRRITRAQDNVLYQLDDSHALELYKTYLGEYSKDLPASALFFPLAVSPTEDGEAVVRTILNVDEENQSMIFAGDMPEGHYTRLMRANFDRLIDGAQGAAEQSLQKLMDKPPQLTLLISCIGRKLVLGQRVEEELEQVSDVVGNDCVATGFYSYGEISPLLNSTDCKLHNQTMTITTFAEVVNA